MELGRKSRKLFIDVYLDELHIVINKEKSACKLKCVIETLIQYS